MMNSPPPRGAQAALRAIRLLKVFSAERPELSLAEISASTGLNKTTAHRLLAALISESLIDRDDSKGRYRLGTGLMALGVQALSSNDLRQRVRPLLRRMANESGETATLEVPVDDSMLILDEVAGRHFVGAAGNVGTRWPMHATSTGKALLAFEPEFINRLEQRLKALTPKTIRRRDDLEAILAAVRERGYAETVDELEPGFSGVGTVIRSKMGEVLGTLSICGPSQRMGGARRAELGRKLRAEAALLRAE